ncbi:molybdopterin-guanine dinucleotide biosynthesis protein B [Oceanobacillus senegalensis]|uniref:molybdopterin-guanine dinucleotide biosynthesis protein B n=1 Tax=Oceanobacillus senegalensis TaxID=1936063 RepID=UPI000A3063D9|nr:molybdopterin-guanine dinucleotide biosynthesis protein B [Oceanobacillus senegalensis]
MQIIQIVGYKNSGKTTLATKVIETLSKQGKNVASLKHHGHGGVPTGLENTDSMKHKQSGAVVAGVEGDGVLQLVKQTWTIKEMIACYKWMNIETIVMEGFKNEPFPKVVLINRKEELNLLKEVENIQAVILPFEWRDLHLPYPTFCHSEYNVFCAWLMDHLELGFHI